MRQFDIKELYKEEILRKPELWTIQNTHDPGIFKDGDTYYTFSTDAAFRFGTSGVQIRQSTDLVNWTYVGQAILEGVPQEAKEYTNALGLWAPDVVKMNDEYWMYYSASTFGSTQSAIGLAKSKQVTGPYKHEALVYKSRAGEMHMPNAIDANIVFDQQGNMYMCYGSFFGGIYLVKLDSKTGLIKQEGDKGTLIAGGSHQAIEGPYIIYNEEFDFYYLFVSFESLTNKYNIRVARSKHITGPYVDSMGNDMRDIAKNPGNKIVNSYGFSDFAYLAPGHNSVLKDGDRFYMVHHSRCQVNGNNLGGCFFLNIRQLFFTDSGWPIVAPNRHFKEHLEPIQTVSQMFDVIVLDKNNDHILRSERHEIAYQICDHDIVLTYKQSNFQGKIYKMYNFELDQEFHCFTAMNEEGQCIWGQEYKGE